MAVSDIELLKIQVETLFKTDDVGRLRVVNEPYSDGSPTAPSLFVGIARYGSIVRFGSDLPESVCKRIEVFIGDYVHIGDVRSNPPFLDDLMDVIRPYLKTDRVWKGPAYRFPKSMKSPNLGVRVNSENSHLLKAEFADYIPDLKSIGSVAAVVERGRAVSICHSARRSERAEEAGVETIPSRVGRGYATAAVACWARMVRDRGRIPLYSTSWDNAASQRVAEKLGLIMYGANFHDTRSIDQIGMKISMSFVAGSWYLCSFGLVARALRPNGCWIFRFIARN